MQDQRVGEGWDEARLLRGAVLRELLYSNDLRSNIAPEGVRIMGALFRDEIALADGELYCHLWLECCRFEKAIDLSRQSIPGTLSLEESFVAMADEDSPSVSLAGATIKGSVNLFGSSIESGLNMISLAVGQDLTMGGSQERPATFAQVDLSAAKVEGQLDLTGATVKGQLGMRGRGPEVGRNLYIGGNRETPPTFAEVDLSGANVEGWLIFNGATVNR